MHSTAYTFIPELQQGLRRYDGVASPVWDDQSIEAYETKINNLGQLGYDLRSLTIANPSQNQRYKTKYKVWADVRNYWEPWKLANRPNDIDLTHEAYTNQMLIELDEEGYSFIFEERGYFKELYDFDFPQPAILYVFGKLIPQYDEQGDLRDPY